MFIYLKSTINLNLYKKVKQKLIIIRLGDRKQIIPLNYNQCTPFAIYKDNIIAGYVMVIYDYDEET